MVKETDVQAAQVANAGTQSTIKQALLKITELKQRIQELESPTGVPVAIVGAGVRAPGGIDSPESLWTFLRQGRCAVSEVPIDRWDAAALFTAEPGTPGTVYTRHGSFIPGIDQFDPAFFNISGREAEQIDPQQRLLLETTWEALENASIAPTSLLGQSCGVFVGMMNQDYADFCTGPGTSASVASGRLAYVFGVHGPTLTVDTACSSGLVALHLACKALARGECEMAIVAAVNLQITAKMTLAECEGRMLSPDGICKTFDAGADGFGRSDGCITLVLRTADQAARRNDRMLAIVRGSAVNHDGASGGLTVPNGPAQEQVLLAALNDAALQAGDIDLIEAHGTGTPLGDPIELNAIEAVYGNHRGRPLLVGSAKTNFGHMEAAAGLMGVLKAALAVTYGYVPAHLHLQEPNPHFDWQSSCIQVPLATMPWPTTGQLRRAAVNAFGISGTNAHVIIEQVAQAAAVHVEHPKAATVLKLSARTKAALRDSAARLAAFLANAEASNPQLARTLNLGRADFEHRLAFVHRHGDESVSALRAFTEGGDSEWLAQGEVEAGQTRKLAWLFTGQGSQYAGMGRVLYDDEPRFRAALDEAGLALQPHLGMAVRDLLFDGGSTSLDDTRYTQPALFALQYALGKFWLGMGLQPDVLVGHSVGEFAVACLAGVFSLEDAARLIAARGRLMDECCAPGAMAAVLAPLTRAQIEPWQGKLSIAAFNGPANTVISGEPEAVSAWQESLRSTGVQVQALNVSHAFHSPMMRPMLSAFADVAEGVTYHAAQWPIVSTLTGRREEGTMSCADYWVRHVSQPVRFADSVSTLCAEGVDATLEIGPQGTLTAMLRRCPGTGGMASYVSLRKGAADTLDTHRTLAGLYALGCNLDWKAINSSSVLPVWAPTYPFQRQSYWIAGSPKVPTRGNLQSTGYNAVWREHALPEAIVAQEQRIAVLGSKGDLAAWLPLLQGGAEHPLTPLQIELPDIWEDLLEQADSTDVVYLDDSVACTGPLLRAMQTALRRGIRFWSVRVSDDPDIAPPSMNQAMLQVAATEMQKCWGAAITVAQADHDHADAILQELRTQAGEDQIFWQGRVRRVRRIAVERLATGQLEALDPDACYWVTGGLGDLGLALASALIERGARNLVLISRRGERGCDERVGHLLQAWRARGIALDAPALDITDASGVRALMLASGTKLRGLVHAAGIEDFCELADLDEARLERMLSAKVDGLQALASQLPWSRLDFLVAITSMSALWGGQGSLHYAAANAWLESWIGWARLQGLPCAALRLGPVLGAGMVDGARAEQLARIGLLPLSRMAALSLLDAALRGERAVLTSCELDLPRFLAAMQARRGRPVFGGLVPASAGDEPAVATEAWRTLSPEQFQNRLWDLLERTLRAVLRLPDAVEIGIGTSVQQLGVDSLLAIELRDHLSAAFGLALASTFVFDHGTPKAMARALTDLLSGDRPEQGRDATEDVREGSIAVVGVACRFPGGANDPESFWALLKEARCAIDDMPARLRAHRFHHADPDTPNHAYSMSAGLIDDVELFAAPFFGISPREALCMDPQQRLVLETAWAAIERAGWHPDDDSMRSTGVFVGVGSNEYADLLMQDASVNEFMGHVPTGNALNAIAGRVSFTFDFEGPCMAIDTACSSSLVAIHEAIGALRRGDCGFALAGGVNLALKPESFVMLCKSKMLSPSGRCKSFDAEADGYARGEGCGMLVLRRLEEAERDGDPILGVIHGSAVNQDGRSSSLTAPNGTAQQRVLRAALADARLSPDTVSYVEAHGTGTPLGDPIEMHALAAVYGSSDQRKAPLLVGSVKSNLGHLEAAAGIAGVIKVLLMLERRILVPSVHFRALNPRIELDSERVRVCADVEPWSGQGKLVAGVSSFGFSGTNAHVLIGSHDALDAVGPPSGGSAVLPFVLSARSDAELRAYAGEMARAIDALSDDIYLQAICASVHTARSDLGDWRLLVAVSSRGRLVEALLAVADGHEHAHALISREKRRRRGTGTPKPMQTLGLLTGLSEPWQRLASEWLQGLPVAWPRAAGMRRVALPSYPFERQRYWPRVGNANRSAADSGLRRLSLLAENGAVYEQAVDASVPAHVRDHRIFGEVLLAGASHVAAVLRAALQEWPTQCVQLDDLAFEQARTLIGEQCRWQIALSPAGDAWQAESWTQVVDEPPATPVRHFSARLRWPALPGEYGGMPLPDTSPSLFGPNLYRDMQALGYHLGDSFQWLDTGWLLPDQQSLWALRAPVLPEPWADYPIYPGLIDSCFHAIGERMQSNEPAGSEWIFVPFSVQSLTLYAPVPEGQRLYCRAWLDDSTKADVGQASGGAALFDERGRLLLGVERFRARRARRNALHGDAKEVVQPRVYRWRELPFVASPSRSISELGATVVAGAGGGVAQLVAHLASRGVPSVSHWASIRAGETSLTDAAIESLILVCDPITASGPMDDALVGTFTELQALLGGNIAQLRRVVILLPHASPRAAEADALLAARLGLSRALLHEYPEICWQVLDLPDGLDERTVEGVVVALAHMDFGRLSVRTDGVRGLSLAATPLSQQLGEWQAEPNRTYLISGAFGGIGLRLCHWLLDHGARHLLLCGRSGRSLPEQLRAHAHALGAELRIEVADIGETHVREQLLTALAGMPSLSGIFHAAGITDDGLLSTLNEKRVRAMLAAKCQGTRTLLDIAKSNGAALFVSFSSMSAHLGVPGQSTYGAANAAMEAMTVAQGGRHLCALSVAFGPWAEAGMAARLGSEFHDRAHAMGIRPLLPDQALASLGTLIQGGQSGVRLMVDFDWERFANAVPPCLLSQLPINDVPSPRPHNSPDSLRALRHALASRETLADANEACLRYCVDVFAAVTAQHGSTIDVELAPVALGMDSLLAIEIRRRLDRELGIHLEAATLLEIPSLRELAIYLLRQLTAAGTAAGTSSAPAAASAAVVSTIEVEL
ncbi:type I polyketide synthase [Frateuria sp. Soil773]|uniref:type I polyketide synthase n=1 Tax=Frateuria sp. Soil773 TaxID=1736407 RepID=UPI00138F4738|nr:type I polyketide synthase [Frateuria sp. Soil773]